jgi:hypothetical protein
MHLLGVSPRDAGTRQWPIAGGISFTNIHTPTKTLARLETPCTPKKNRRLTERDHITGMLIVIAITIMPTIDPRPKMRMDKSPAARSVVAARIISISAADPASPCAMPTQKGRMDSSIQCRWR